MAKRSPGYWVFLVITILCTLAAVGTLVPDATAHKMSILGYYAHCPFAPWSSLIALALAAISCVVRAEVFKKKTEKPKA